MNIAKAMLFAQEKHKAQEGYFLGHLMPVYQILDLLKLSDEVKVAGLLHDTIEDTNTTYEELEREFGKQVADLVMEVTHEGKKDEIGYYFPRLKSKEAIIIKFADRLSNLTRMSDWDEERQQQYLRRSKFWKSDAEKLK